MKRVLLSMHRVSVRRADNVVQSRGIVANSGRLDAFKKSVEVVDLFSGGRFQYAANA